MNTEKTAKIYDLDTKSVSEIPLVELAPGMIKIEILGVGKVWVSSKRLHEVTDSLEQNSYRHPPFSGKLRNLVRSRIMEPLGEVHPLTLKQWEDGFRRDANAEKEIAIWCVIAARFKAFIKANRLNRAQRKEAFKLTLHCTAVPSRQAFWASCQPNWLSREQVETLIAPFEKNWRSDGEAEEEE